MTPMDYLLINSITSHLSKFSTGYIIFDILFSGIALLISTVFFNEQAKRYTTKYIYNLINSTNKTTSLTFTSSDKKVSGKYRGLMHYLREKNDPTVKSLIETELTKYNSRKDEDEVHASVYRVCQSTLFTLSKEDKIFGKVFISNKDKYDYSGKVINEEYHNLEISSTKLTSQQLIDWVDNREKEYKEFLKTKALESQSLIEVSWNSEENEVECLYTKWESNVTFDNRFFSGKKDIVDKIRFFLENEKWYEEKGIPYTLGILLWGEPGCGKTGFIKALMNLTGRHGIDVKLNNNFNFSKLREIIYDEQICDDIIIPQNKRLFIFEDIDAMGDIVKDRDLQKTDQDIEIEKKVEEFILKKYKPGRRKKIDDEFVNVISENSNNNLSYLLNILDGLNECPGRIIIMTSNKPKQLDSALTRPGRIDYKIHMTKATIDDIKKLLEFYWNVPLEMEIPPNWEQKLSHAEITNCCRVSNDIQDTINKIILTMETIDQRNSSSPEMKIDFSISNRSPEPSPQVNYVNPTPSPTFGESSFSLLNQPTAFVEIKKF
jgi:ATP-dependent 26S proteasome regulatory subunit